MASSTGHTHNSTMIAWLISLDVIFLIFSYLPSMIKNSLQKLKTGISQTSEFLGAWLILVTYGESKGVKEISVSEV